MPSSVRAWRRSGRRRLGSRRRLPPASASRARELGQEADDLRGGRPERRPSSSCGSARERGPIGPDERAVGLVGRRPASAVARRTVIGSARAADPIDRLVEEAGDADAGRPADQHRPGPAVRRRRRGRPRAARTRSSRPTNRALVYLPGMAAFYGRARPRPSGLRSCGACGGRSARLARDDRRPRARPTPPTRSTSCPARSGSTSRSRVLTTAYPSELGHAARKAHGANKPPRLMARLIEFFTPDRRARARPVRRRRRDAARGGHRARPATGARHRARPALGGGLRARSSRDLAGRARRRSGRCSPTSAPPTRAARAASTRPGSSCGVGDALAVLPTLADGVGRLRRDRPALQPPAAADDGRRRAGRDPRQPPDRLRDGHRLSRRTSPTPPTTRRSSTGWSVVFGELAAGPARPGATRWSSSATPTRTGATCSPASDLAARARAVGLVPRAISSGTRPARGCGRTAIRGRSSRTSPPAHPGAAQGADAPSVARGGASRGRPSRTSLVDVGLAHRPASRPRSASWRPARRLRCSLADRRRQGSSCGSSPAGRRGRGPASRRRASRAAGPRRPGPREPISRAAQLVGRVEQADDACSG